MSSSAAFSVALLLALGHDPDPVALAHDCQEAERGAGAHVGLLDPLAIAGARAGHALLIDFATLDTRHVPIPDDAAFVIVHSETPRLLTTTPYADEARRVRAGGTRPGPATRACELGDLSQLADPVLRRRARHVITECARVRDAEQFLARGNLVGLGAVMTEGHRSLAADYRVSVAAVDELVDAPRRDTRRSRCPHDRRRLRRLRHCAVPAGLARPRTRRPTRRAGPGGSVRLPAQRFLRRSHERIEHPERPAAVDRLRGHAPHRSRGRRRGRPRPVPPPH